jgi:hypothetical protein
MSPVPLSNRDDDRDAHALHRLVQRVATNCWISPGVRSSAALRMARASSSAAAFARLSSSSRCSWQATQQLL